MSGRRWDRIEVDAGAAMASVMPVALIDQAAAGLRDRLDGWGLSTADTDAVYAVLAGQQMLVDQLRHGVAAGKVPAAVIPYVERSVAATIALLLDQLPAEARS